MSDDKRKDNSGRHRVRLKEQNQARVAEYLAKNPNTTQAECGSALGLSVLTVRRHMRALADAGNK